MNNVEAEKVLIECDNDLSNALSIFTSIGATSNIVPYLNKYCIIRACGSLEVSFKTIIADFINKRSKKQIKKYINENVRENSANPSYNNICNLLKSFDLDWWREFKKKFNQHPKKHRILTSVESLVDARNEFAHGGSPNLSLSSTIQYFTTSRVMIEILDDVVN